MKQTNTSAFSIIEVMISIFVFALGLTSIFMMLSGSISMSDYSRNLIMASYLANEELELFKNIRDSNYTAGKKWNFHETRQPYNDSPLRNFTVGKKYKLENNYSPSANNPVSVEEIISFTEIGADGLIVPGMEDYRLCLDSEGRYIYCLIGSTIKTPFYRYLSVEPASYKEGVSDKTLDNPGEAKAFKITATVIWAHKKIHMTEISTIVTDWKRY